MERLKKCHYQQIEDIRIMLVLIANRMFSNMHISVGSHGEEYLIGEAFDAAANTLIAIDFCSQQKFYSDAYTLVRKYRDDLLQYIFISYYVEQMQGLTEEELNKIFGAEIDADKLYEAVLREYEALSSDSRKSDIEKAVDLWLHNSLDSDDKSKVRKKYFDTSKYKTYLMGNETVKELFELYLGEDWKNIDRTLNNYVHGNGKKYILDNFPNHNTGDRLWNELIATLRGVTKIVIAILAITEPILLSSSDYIDALEFGEQPEEGSQYYIMPCVVEFMSEYFGQDLVHFIDINNPVGMLFDRKHYE